ncbi:putative ABC transport system ATP-binding protein [Gracilibacillus halotolerans]|uniref:Putative ABC transport system ATP-binding protein n=1 Tax=Gracilibacillus halotolerans TaxID=74386 RepID=A0A841RMP5_9BACI|nr:ABC transporter ATP-binding protein [Gracilibacillus halotolerans]MBB6511968.1 putative ABC transport system ATP-binding protein [Gracilibacillus halotolerans]
MFLLKDIHYKDILHIPYLEIKSGEITCLFGESGSGKSTLLRMLNNMITPDKGEIRYQNQSISEYIPMELRQEVVMLGQEPIVFDGTVRDNLLKGLEFSGKPEVDDSSLLALMNELKLHKKLDEDASKLSGGEKQRVAFGRVLLMGAKVYLLDEPTSALDEETENSIMDFVTTEIKKKKKTAIMVTHSKYVAKEYSDTIIYMNEIATTPNNKVGTGHE